MGDDQNELSDEEYDALLQDLESRASEGGGDVDVDSDDDGDIDDFLKSIESQEDEQTSAPTATADDDDDLAGDFAALEQEGELTAPEGGDESASKAAARSEEKKKTPAKTDGDAARRSDEKGPSRGRTVALAVLKNALWVVPALAAWWVLGVFLAQWVSAGWLIAIMSALVIGGLPAVGRSLVERGGYRRWIGGVSLLAVVALIAPMPNIAADNVAEYGHWPSTAIAELSGQPADAGFVSGQAAMSGWLAGVISTSGDEVSEPRQLGTIFPLGMEWPPEETIPGLEDAEDMGDVEEAILEQEQQEQQETTEQGDTAAPAEDEDAVQQQGGGLEAPEPAEETVDDGPEAPEQSDGESMEPDEGQEATEGGEEPEQNGQ